MELIHGARARARKKGVPFALKLSDIEVPTHCPALGVPLVKGIGRGPGPQPNSPTLDRIDPALGYIPGNVVVISHRANAIKSDATVDEIERVAAWLRGLDR